MKQFVRLAAVVLAATAFTASADIVIQKRQNVEKPYTRSLCTVRGAGPFVQTFVYYEFNQPKGGKTLANNMGNVCGLNYGWFSSGMISAVYNRKIQLMDQPYLIKERKNGFDFTMSGRDCTSELKYTFFPTVDYVICSANFKTPDPAKPIVVTLYARPGHAGYATTGKKVPFNRHYTTAVRTGKLGNNIPAVTLDSAKENWLMLTDEFNENTGTSILVYDPAEVEKITVKGNSDLVYITIALKPGKTSCKFLCRGIPETYLEADEVLAEMKQKSGDMVKFLKEAKD